MGLSSSTEAPVASAMLLATFGLTSSSLKMTFTPFCLHELDDPGHGLRVGLGVGLDTLDGQLLEVVGVAQVAERLMGDHDGAIRSTGQTLGELLVELVAFGSPRGVVGLVLGLALGIGGNERVFNVRQVS